MTWSFSSLTKFENCPRQYHVVKVLKAVVEPPTEATEWGTAVHEALEFRVRDGTPLPATMAKYEPIAARLAASKGEVFTELEIGLTKDLQSCAFDDTDCWYRGIIDIGCAYTKTVFLGDYKTGKVKSDHDQLNLFSAAYLTMHPQFEVARSAYIWLAHDKMTRRDVPKDQVPVIWADYKLRVARMEAAFDQDKWVPRPSGLCRGWCPVGREHCEFWSPKRSFRAA